MKQVSLSLSIFLSTSVMLVAQSAPNAFVADELTNELCSEGIKARIDGFIVKLNENPRRKSSSLEVPTNTSREGIRIMGPRCRRHLSLDMCPGLS